jgi:hypothetical protein
MRDAELMQAHSTGTRNRLLENRIEELYLHNAIRDITKRSSLQFNKHISEKKKMGNEIQMNESFLCRISKKCVEGHITSMETFIDPH